MKYRDPVTGEFKEISVKASDTLPIGTIVEYDGTTIPDGWETVDDTGTYKKIKKIATSIGVLGKVLTTKSNSTNDTYSCDYINKLSTYSTEEQVIGTWVDGKPLYRKTIYANSLPNNTNAFYDFTNNKSIINMAWIDESNSFILARSAATGEIIEIDTLNYIYSTSAYIMTCIKENQIRIRTTSDKTSDSAYITVLYTKTTD